MQFLPQPVHNRAPNPYQLLRERRVVLRDRMFNRSDRCPCPPCPSLCVRGVGFRVLSYRAQLGRLGGSRQEALATVMGGQQVCIQTFRPCNDGGVIVTTQYQIFFPRKVDLARN